MFNLFSKKTEVKETIYPEIVEQIHNEFFTAGDNILEEAKQLLNELSSKDLAKGERLAAIGFNKTREAAIAIETKNKVATTKEIADLVVYYKENYPFNKFITEEQVKSICEKYGLVCGVVSMYKGFVPENKLSLIERFKLKEADIKKIWFEVTESLNEGDVKLAMNYISFNDLTERGKEYFTGINNLDFFYIKDAGSRNSNLLKEQISVLFNGLCFVQAKIASKELKICAPLKDMEVGTRQEVVGYKIQDIPDPVVLQPVNGGYLIVCAWGDEASDPIVVNETSN